MRTAARPAGRLDALDGVRTVAILWVALYHYAVFWAPSGKGEALLPYGDALAWIPGAGVGALGVSMFFVVSGAVIALSLERSASALDFAVRRLLRLWPTLLLCGALTFAATTWFGPEALRVDLPEFAISLAFLPPEHVGRALGESWQWLDGAYWSLWVEVRFYGIAAILFWAARRRFLLAWTVFAVLCAALQARFGADHALAGLLFTEFQPFFTMGIALAAMRRSPTVEPGPLAVFLLGAVLALAYASETVGDRLALIGAILLPALACLARRPLPVLSWAPMTRIGRASYAYYLLHQNFGLALLAALGPMDPAPAVAAMLAVQAAILGLSILLTERVETPIRRGLTARLPRAGAVAA